MIYHYHSYFLNSHPIYVCIFIVSLKECPTTEEEPTFILTLVEIPADSEDCRGVPGSLEQTPADLLPAPVLFTSPNTDAVELIGQDR